MVKKLCLIILSWFCGKCYAVQWHNWANNQQCNATIITPKNDTELTSIIEKIKKENSSIHAYGSSHSWSDIVCVDGYLINTDKLNKIVSVDVAKKQVTVQAGIKLYDLNKKLAKLGLCLSNQGAITKQSLAGVVSTATHGSGKTGTFASFITQIKLLTADGTIKTISQDENKNLFPVVRTSMGTLGIMLELTIQCEPLFTVQRTLKTSSWADIVQEYKNLLKNNDYMQFYWNAANDSVDIIIHNRIEKKNRRWSLIENIQPQWARNQGYSYEMLSGTLNVIYVEEEIAIPIDKFIEAANAARLLVQKERQKNSMFDGILFRFVAAEKDNLLSPAAGRDVVYFSITTSHKAGYEEFYKKFYTEMLQYNGRPHWGKINYLTKEDTQKLYGKNYDDFVTVRKQLDPGGLFSNEFTKRIFGW